MRLFSYARVEINRIFRARLTWIFVILTAASPLPGFTVFRINITETAGTQMILNPLLTGAIGSAILFALFTLLELDRVNKFKVFALTNAIAPVITLHAAKMIAVLSVSLIAGLLTILIYFPFTMVKMESFANPKLYLSAYLLFLIPAMWFGSLFSAVFYQLSRRMDVSFILIAACLLMGFHFFSQGDFLLSWVIINIPVFSDGFGNATPLRMGLYNRFFWLMFLFGVWIISLLCTRKYGKGLFGSVKSNAKKWPLSVIGVLLVLLSINHYRNQPFYNNAPLEVNWGEVLDILDNNRELNVISVRANIKPNIRRGTLFGEITYIFDESSAFGKRGMVLNSGYTLFSITADGKPIEFTDLANDTFTLKNIVFYIPAGTTELKIQFGGFPMMWGASWLHMSGPVISRNNIDLMNNSLIPAKHLRDTDVEVSIILPGNFTLIPLHSTVREVFPNGDNTKTWIISSSIDNIGILAADYKSRIVEADFMSAEFFYHRNFHTILEENDINGVLIDVFNFCTERFGPLSYLLDDHLKLIQTTAFNFGGGAFWGVSMMSETTFSIYSLTDPWKGASGREILAHEIIHQWWGLNRMIWEDPDFPAWTAEGLTVYTTYRLFREKYGELYGRINYVERWKQAVEEMNRNFYRRNPQYLDILPEHFAARIRVNEQQVLRYSLMPLLIRRATELVGGEEIMDKILWDLSQSNNFQPLTFQEFLDACGLTREDLGIE